MNEWVNEERKKEKRDKIHTPFLFQPYLPPKITSERRFGLRSIRQWAAPKSSAEQRIFQTPRSERCLSWEWARRQGEMIAYAVQRHIFNHVRYPINRFAPHETVLRVQGINQFPQATGDFCFRQNCSQALRVVKMSRGINIATASLNAKVFSIATNV